MPLTDIRRRFSLRTLMLLFCMTAPLVTVVMIASQLWGQQGFAFETPLMLWIHANVGGWFAPVAVALHYVGKTALAVPVIALVAVWLAFRKRLKTAVFIVFSTLLPTLVMLAVKSFFARPRPKLWPRIVEEANYSFPSGHATFGAALAMIVFLLWRGSPHCRAVAAGCVAFALSMGFSRLYLGVHYPTDVFAGWVNGAFSTLLVYKLLFRK
ncbi:phosphatase PAP2 family protein [Neisseria chenwenguii]|uniref:Phosphatase PAP2 family protein n=1 Tax=Neisseria chenwenguii TaxID=1853278 RepID=A0A220S0Y8_9NEIS|nr:phosphatase PAP2 family protein [Neisseria chenwenguii]ASK27072.1 phosphatase PAP2 family protein [Neisseria chenwenguii]